MFFIRKFNSVLLLDMLNSLGNINTIEDLINNYVNTTKEDKNIKKYLESLFGVFITSSFVDENMNFFLINVSELLKNLDSEDEYYNIVLKSKSILYDKKENKILFRYYNIINENSTILNSIKWDNVVVNYIYPGLNIYLYYYDDKWELISETSLNYKYNNNEFGTLDIIYEKLIKRIDVDSLNKEYYYNIIYQNNKGKNIVDNCLINNTHDDFLYVSAFELYTNKYILYEINGLNKIPVLHFSCMHELMSKLEYLSTENKINKKITYSGFHLKIYENNVNLMDVYKFSELYKKIKENIDINENIYRVYMELYQKNKLSDILPYISKYSNEIIHRLNVSVKTLSRELLNIYHMTRKKKHKELYILLPDLYKKILYGIHGVYINSRRKDIINREQQDYDESKSITIHDVYYYVKDLTSYQLIQLFKERIELLKKKEFSDKMNNDCIHTLAQTKLMMND